MEKTLQNIFIVGVLIPLLHPTRRYNILVHDNKVQEVQLYDIQNNISAYQKSSYVLDYHNQPIVLWPGFVENHAHLALPTNVDNLREPAAIIKSQYLYFGITHVIDLFGFPEIKQEWFQGSTLSPQVTHCGYALTSPTIANKIGHGSEYPVPINIIDTEEKLNVAIENNINLGATFLKVMYSSGIEKHGDTQRFSLLDKKLLKKIVEIAHANKLECIIDCNTLNEVKEAAQLGYHYFAHPVRDVIMTDKDWEELKQCHFISTLQGLKPLTMTGQDMQNAYRSRHFKNTQLPNQERYFETVSESYGSIHGLQTSRMHALNCMHINTINALNCGQGLIGSDAGNTLAYHGYSYYQELQTFFNDNRLDRKSLLEAATVKARHFLSHLSKKILPPFFYIGTYAEFNLIRSNDILPMLTILGNNLISQEIITHQISQLRLLFQRNTTHESI